MESYSKNWFNSFLYLILFWIKIEKEPSANPVKNQGLISLEGIDIVVNFATSLCLERILTWKFLSEPIRVHLKCFFLCINCHLLVALLLLHYYTPPSGFARGGTWFFWYKKRIENKCYWFRSAISHFIFNHLLTYYRTWVITSATYSLSTIAWYQKL